MAAEPVPEKLPQTSVILPPAAATEPEIKPRTTNEYITAMSHYYRGEMARMMSWRDRLDRTTNWAITVAAAMLSVSLSSPNAHHGVLIFGMLLVCLLLLIEARRYRFFDTYRQRVRLLERNYYAPVFATQQVAEANWMKELGLALRAPRFHLTLNQAMARRLRRNYSWIFLILLLAWLLKTTTAVLQPGSDQHEFIHSTGEWAHNAAIGYLSGWIVLAVVLLFYGWLGYVMWKHKEADGELAYGQVHV